MGVWPILAKGGTLTPLIMACKAVLANSNPTVKQSDKLNKAMGPAAEVERYKRVFGVGGQERVEVVV